MIRYNIPQTSYQVESLFVAEPIGPGDSWPTVAGSVQRRTMLGDLQKVHDGSALGTLGMLDKQMASIGLRDVASPLPLHDDGPPDDGPPALHGVLGAPEAAVAQEAWAPPLPPPEEHPPANQCLHIFTAVTDAGSDEAKARRLLHTRMMQKPNAVFFDGNCMAHQYQLMVLSVTHFMDFLLRCLGCKYFYWSSLAKLMNVWRSKAAQIYTVWKDMFGPTDAEKFASKVPPRAIAGRWGSIRDVERWLLRCNWTQLETVLSIIYDPRSLADAKEQETTGINEISQESKAEYIAKLSKWAKDVMSFIKDPIFRMAIQISTYLREPLDKFYHKIQKAWRYHEEPTNLARLVWGGAKEISDEIASRLDSRSWTFILDEAPLIVKQAKLAELVMKGSMRVAAGFHRRVTTVLSSSPYNLLWLARTEAHMKCSRRQELALELLDTADAQLHITARIMKRLFREELKDCAMEGTISMCLYAPMRLLALSWRADTQEIEGVNNLISMATDRAPKISLALLDARVATRKDVGLGSRATKYKKYTVLAPRIKEILDDAVQHADGVQAVLERKGRWAGPQPATDPGENRESVAPCLYAPQVLTWATTYNMGWYRAAERRNANREESIIVFRGQPHAWVCMMTYYYTGHLLKFDVMEPATESSGPILRRSDPVEIKSSLDIFAELYPLAPGNEMLVDCYWGSSCSADEWWAVHDDRGLRVHLPLLDKENRELFPITDDYCCIALEPAPKKGAPLRKVWCQWMMMQNGQKP